MCVSLCLQLRSSLQNVKEGKALQSTPGVSMHVRRHSHDKVLKGSLESVAMTTSSQMNGPAEQRLPQLERGGVTSEWNMLTSTCHLSHIS